MDGDQLLVWLEPVPERGEPLRMGVICRRHADAMVVPRGWTLDDRRESRPRLFRVSASSSPARAKPARQRPLVTADSANQPEQLTMSMEDIGVRGGNTADVRDDVLDEVTVGEIRPLGAPDANETQAIPWRFEFNERDDLGGVLDAKSPLLSRAFRGQQRTAESDLD